MRSKLWWFTSAALLWMVTAFIGLIAMVGAALETLFEARDVAAVVRAGGSWIFLVSAGLAAALALLRGLGRADGRSGPVIRDIATQAAAIAAGGACATLFGAAGPVALPVFGIAAFLFLRSDAAHGEDAWRRPGSFGLAAATSAFVIGFAHL